MPRDRRRRAPGRTRPPTELATPTEPGGRRLIARARIAPTPSGYVHVGNAVNFLLAGKVAAESGADLLLRIDDLDTPRTKAGATDLILRTLEALALEWDEGKEVRSIGIGSGQGDLLRCYLQKEIVR